jgi:PAS domain S-box-containing protein
MAAIEHEHSDEELRRSEATYRDLYENAPHAYFTVTSLDGSIRKCNAAASRLLGYDKESLTGMNVLDLYADTPHGVPRAQDVFKRFQDGLAVRDIEMQMVRKNGDPIWISLTIEPVRDRDGNIIESRSMVIDISERKEAQARIASAKEEWERTFDAVPDLVMILDNKHRIVRANKAMLDSLDCSPEELVGQTCYEVMHASKEPPHFCPHAKALLDGQEHTTEVPGDRLEGHFLVSVSPLRGPDGEIVGSVHVARDITERKQVEATLRKAHLELEQHVEDRTAVLMRTVKRLKKEVKDRRQAEDALAEAQQRYRTVADFTYDWEYWLGPEKDLLYVSPSCERITGYLPEEFLMKDYEHLMKIVHPDDRKTVGAHITEEFDSDEANHLDFRIITRSGETRWISHYCQPVSGSDGERLGRRASNRDITERKRGEEALLKSEMQLRRLSTQLLKVQESERKRIAGDLHDGIGQSLSAIKFGIETVVDRLENETAPSTIDTLQSLVPMLQDAIEDVRKTVMNLRPSMLDDLGVLATISWFVRQFQAVYSGIRVEEQINVQEANIPEGLKTNIFRVLQEAANNIAKHSSGDRVSVSLSKENESLELTIKDNGRGFDPESVFETEDAETGFGITSMKERTELSGGSFSIQSKEGAGTTIRAVWPCRS